MASSKEMQAQLDLANELVAATKLGVDADNEAIAAKAKLVQQAKELAAAIPVTQAQELKASLMESAKNAADLNQRTQSHLGLMDANIAIKKAQLQQEIDIIGAGTKPWDQLYLPKMVWQILAEP